MPPRIPERELKTKIDNTVHEFFDHLTPEEKDLYTATGAVENLLADVASAEKQHKAKSTSRKASAALEPFIASIEQYATAFDTIANASSMVLCPLWGSFRVVLHLAREYSEYFDKITDMMETMGAHLRIFYRLPPLYPRSEQLKGFMVEVFQIMFDFCTKSRAVFVQASERKGKNHLRAVTPIGLSTMIKLIWKPFKLQFGGIKEKLSVCMSKIEFEINLAEKEAAHEERVRAAKDRIVQASRWEETEQFHKKWEHEAEGSEREKVIKWLGPADVTSNHNASSKLRHGDTGSWFLSSDPFQAWLGDDSSPFFWLHAIPGAGKTILTSSVINYIRHDFQSDEVGLAYFYCDYKDPMKQDPAVVLRTLLAQLSNQNIAVFQHVQSFFKDQYKDNPNAPSLDLVRSNFEPFLRTSFQKVFIVIDAVDECHDRECILSSLAAIGESVGRVKIFISSREDLAIHEQFKDFPNLKMRPKHVSADLESYVDATLNARIAAKKLKVKDEDLRREILGVLTLKAEGMFQWINCQIDHLCKFKTHNAIREALKDLPKTLEDIYLRILKSIDDENADIVQKILKWLVRGTRELKLDELASAVAINPQSGNENMDPDDLMDPEDIIGYCGSLVTVSDSDTVSLAHFTVKEFLTSERIKESLSTYYVGEEEVHAELSEVCITYLNYRDFDRRKAESPKDMRQLMNRFNFLEYASKSWAVHAQHVSASEGLIHQLIERLFHSSNQRRGNYDLWLQMYCLQCRHDNLSLVSPPHSSPLYYASYFGLPKIVGSLLDEDMEPMIGDGADDALSASSLEGRAEVIKILLQRCFEGHPKETLGPYLYLAASRGHAAATELLLEWGAPIEAKVGKHGTALQVAALEGHPKVVRILLQRGANFKVIDSRFGVPLSAAAERGHRYVTQLLLDAGASVNWRGGWHGTPLIAAIVGKDESIINRFLDNGADVNIQGGRHDCALMAAATLGKIDLVKKLIDLGAKVNDENDKGADALHSACCAGRLDVVELLLASGADVNAKGGKHRNALNAASAEGYRDIVQTLLDAGADHLAFDDHYGNCLQAATTRGHKDIVKILSGAGVDVNASGGARGCALVCAASTGSIEMVDALISLGVPTGNTQDMRDALVIATRKQNVDLIRHMVELGADIDGVGLVKSTNFSWNPLALAANKGNLSLVQTILSLGADTNAKAGLHGTVLIAATDSDHCNHNILEALLASGANINAKVTPESYLYCASAIFAAVKRTDMKALEMFLDNGANPDVFVGCHSSPLMAAVSQRNEVFVNLLLNNGADVNLCIVPNLNLDEDTGTITPLEEAAREGYVNIIYLLVEHGAFLVHTREDVAFKTPLQCAAYYGQDEAVKVLLELGSDPNTIGGVLGSALQAAAAAGKKSCMDMLLDAGSNVLEQHIGKYGSAVIAACLKQAKENGLELLVERGADINLDCGGEFPYAIIAMAYTGDEPGTQFLIDKGADVNKYGGKWHSAIQASTSDNAIGSFEVAEILLAAGADINACGGHYGTALQSAYRCGYFLIIWKLYENGASHSVLGGQWGSALGSAISGACQTLVHQFVEQHKVDVNQICGKWGSALHFLINVRSYDEVNLAELFLDAGANVNAIGGKYSTPLGAAVVEGEPGMVDTLLERGADPNLVWDKSGRNPLLLACRVENLEYVNKLIDYGADVNGCTRRGSILQSAVRGGPVAITERLIECGAKVNAVTPGPYGTALNAAAVTGDLNNLKCLLDHGADIALTGGNFHCALQAAVFKSKLPVIRLLLKHGADVNSTGGRYKTALQAACAAGRIKTVKLLLMNGSDPNITGGQNGNALQAACIYGNATLVRLLLSYGADPKLSGGWFDTPFNAAVLKRNMDIAKVLIAENIGTGLPREKMSHVKENVWGGNEQFLDDVLADDKSLEAFDPNQILIPEEKENESKPEAEKHTLNIVTVAKPSLEPVNGELTAGSSPIGFGSNSLLVPEL